MPGGIEITPRDELSKLPLPVLMKSTDFYFNGVYHEPNYHHHFHPKKSEELGYHEGAKLHRDDPARREGFALRYSRGQSLPIWLHNRYHDIYYGPQLPIETKDKFTTVVLACAGVVPREAINIYDTENPLVVGLNDRQHEFIRRRIFFEGAAGSVKRSKKNSIGRFMAEYALQSSLADVMSEKQIKRKIDQFLVPKSEVQRAEAGRFILSHVVDASVADLIPLHEEAVREKMVKKPRKNLGEVVMRYFVQERFPDYFDPLEQQLSTVF